jgi:Uma2 family endonuclease
MSSSMTTAGRRPGAVCAARRINRPARRRAVFTLHLPQQAGLCYTPYYGRSLKRPAFMTLAEFLAWDAPGGPAWQLIDGVPEAMAPASGTHAVMQGEVGRLIGNHLAAHRPGCRVLTNPGVVPRVNSEDNFRIPDLGVTCAPVPRGVIEIAEPSC